MRLGLANYCRPVLLNFSRIAVPLRTLTRNNVHWKWTEQHQEAFDKLKQSLVSVHCTNYCLTGKFTQNLHQKLNIITLGQETENTMKILNKEQITNDARKNHNYGLVISHFNANPDVIN